MTGNRTEARRIESRNAAPWVGTYICDDYHAHACPQRPESAGGAWDFYGYRPATCWHESTARRLAQQGGPSANAAADLAAWKALGQRRKARAA